MGNRVCEQYHRDQSVCPPNLRQGLFTTAALDNIDHNPSSMTATDSFHGTGISLFQYPTPHNHGADCREHRILEEAIQTKKLAQLPDSYTNVRPLELTRKDAPPPKVMCPIVSDGQATYQALREETRSVFRMKYGNILYMGIFSKKGRFTRSMNSFHLINDVLLASLWDGARCHSGKTITM